MFENIVNAISLYAIPFIIVSIVLFGAFKKVNVYETFTDGAKDGFQPASIKRMPSCRNIPGYFTFLLHTTPHSAGIFMLEKSAHQCDFSYKNSAIRLVTSYCGVSCFILFIC